LEDIDPIEHISPGYTRHLLILTFTNFLRRKTPLEGLIGEVFYVMPAISPLFQHYGASGVGMADLFY
jgi:hypothetical protein